MLICFKRLSLYKANPLYTGIILIHYTVKCPNFGHFEHSTRFCCPSFLRYDIAKLSLYFLNLVTNTHDTTAFIHIPRDFASHIVISWPP